MQGAANQKEGGINFLTFESQSAVTIEAFQNWVISVIFQAYRTKWMGVHQKLARAWVSDYAATQKLL